MGTEQTLDDKTGTLLKCGKAVLGLTRKVIIEAKGKEKTRRDGEKNEEVFIIEDANRGRAVTKDPNRTLFSPKSLRDHNVPGYGEEPIANLGEEELEK